MSDCNNTDMIYAFIALLYSLIASFFINSILSYDETKSIPNTKLQIIKHNLESTPIIDILSGDDCEDIDTSNLLGYYYGTEKHRQTPYQFFKGKRLCTSKRPEKNYFDYIKSSSYYNCPKGTRICGKLDKERKLCIKNLEACPINDIVYNNQPTYEIDNIKYITIEVNENEFLHYTNEKTNNYIITNLTIIGGYGKGFPCGGNDNDNIESFTRNENKHFVMDNISLLNIFILIIYQLYL